MKRSNLATGAVALGLVAFAIVPAMAQKNSGPLLSAPPPPAYNPPPAYTQPRPAPPPIAAPAPGPTGANRDAARLAESLPLDPQTRGLRDTMPADRRGTEARLGLREPRGQAIDLRGRNPTPREIVDALAPRR